MHSACSQRLGYSTRRRFLEREHGNSVLPMRLPKTLLPDGHSDGGDQWVVAVHETFTHSGGHAISVVTCDDPASMFTPVPPHGVNSLGGLFRARITEIPDDVPNWNVGCELLDVSSPSNVIVKLSTPYGGLNNIGGLNLVPELGSQVLVSWTGRLSDVPTILTAPRPTAGSDKDDAPDVRELGPSAFEAGPEKDLCIHVPSGSVDLNLPKDSKGTLRVRVDKDIVLTSEQGELLLIRNGGRVLKVGKEFVDIDPPDSPSSPKRARRASKRGKEATSHGSDSRASGKTALVRREQSPARVESKQYTFSIASLSWIDPASKKYGIPLAENDSDGDPGFVLGRDKVLGKRLYRFANFLEAQITVEGESYIDPTSITQAQFTSASGLSTNTSFLGTEVEKFETRRDVEPVASDGLSPCGQRFIQTVGCRTEAPEKVAGGVGLLAGCWIGVKVGGKAGMAGGPKGGLLGAIGGCLVGAYVGHEAGEEIVEEFYVFPPIWTELELIIYADGQFSGKLKSHSHFPSVSFYQVRRNHPPLVDVDGQGSDYEQKHRYDGVPQIEKWGKLGWDHGNPWRIPSPEGFGDNR